uniref:Uncharacterized protein n=1 Tax=Trypanosoma congolense (strain IL3000) TaxID=1068625 RepID=G0UQL0_TRYCI|nr:conserved hypothetical protein [Trypanosoma congolense IL3000]
MAHTPKDTLQEQGNAIPTSSLEEIAAERIDAVTAEPLHPTKHVEILSPDGVLRLFYNTSTLIRIATDRGMFVQPPHFREPMCPDLQKKIEEIEGRKFRFEAKDTSYHDDILGVVNIQHRHQFFEVIMERFYLLKSAELYVCPTCYLHWISTRYIPYLTESGREIEYVKGDTNPVLDPLDVLWHMQSTPTAEVVANSTQSRGRGRGTASGRGTRRRGRREQEPTTPDTNSGDSLYSSPLAYFVFRRAVHWKKHIRLHHNGTGVAAEDYRLKGFITQFITQYNRLLEEKHRACISREDDGAQGTQSLTMTRYWFINARYNRLRYNRVVECVEGAEGRIQECVNRFLFGGEEVVNTFATDDDDSGSGFICNSDSSSGGSAYAAFPRYEGPDYSSEEDEGERGRRRWRRKERSPSQEEEEENRDSCEAMSSSSQEPVEADPQEQRRQLYKRGLLAPLKRPHRELTYEERQVLHKGARRKHEPVTIYVPTAHQYSSEDEDEGGKDDDDNMKSDNNFDSSCGTTVDCDGTADGKGIWVVTNREFIDWEGIGGTIEKADDYVRSMQMSYSSDIPATETLTEIERRESAKRVAEHIRKVEESSDGVSDALLVPSQAAHCGKGATAGSNKLLLDDSE